MLNEEQIEYICRGECEGEGHITECLLEGEMIDEELHEEKGDYNIMSNTVEIDRDGIIRIFKFYGYHDGYEGLPNLEDDVEELYAE